MKIGQFKYLIISHVSDWKFSQISRMGLTNHMRGNPLENEPDLT